MPQLPENTTYRQLGDTPTKALAKAAISLGKSTGKRRNLKQQITRPQPSDYSNLTSILGSLGTQTVPYGGSTRYEQFHPGVDIANEIGTNIPAFTGGVVSKVISGQKKGSSGFGNYVIVTDPQGGKHRYSHLAQSYVKVGEPIKKGMLLGTMGNTGQTYSETGGTGSHLDYRIVDAYNKTVNPYTYLKNLS